MPDEHFPQEQGREVSTQQIPAIGGEIVEAAGLSEPVPPAQENAVTHSRESGQFNLEPATSEPEQNDPDAGRWDHDKAESIAQVMREDDWEVAHAGREVDEQLKRLWSTEKEIAAGNAEPYSAQYDKHRLHKEAGRLNEVFDKKAPRYEYIYDLNPEKFSQMSVKDFIEVISTIDQKQGKLDEIGGALDKLDDRYGADWQDKIIAGKWGAPSKELIDGLLDMVRSGMRGEEVDGQVRYDESQAPITDLVPSLDTWERPGKEVAAALPDFIATARGVLERNYEEALADGDAYIKSLEPEPQSQSDTI